MQFINDCLLLCPFLISLIHVSTLLLVYSSTDLVCNFLCPIYSRKLQLLRKRDTIYTVSTDGFSLRKAGVVNIGGSSLKWSKSIERHSKKANEVSLF